MLNTQLLKQVHVCVYAKNSLEIPHVYSCTQFVTVELGIIPLKDMRCDGIMQH